MRIYPFSLLLLTLSLLITWPITAQPDSNIPFIRVGLIDQKDTVYFRIKTRSNNNSSGFKNHPWKVTVLNGKPAIVTYRLSVGTSKDSSRAADILDFATRRGLSVELYKHTLATSFKFEFAHQHIYKVLLRAVFHNKEDATQHQLRTRERMNSEIIKLPISRSTGVLQFTNITTGDQFTSANKLRLAAKAIELTDMDVGIGYHWQSGQHRQYTGTLEFLIDEDGRLSLINELPFEEYIRGVVPAEMPPGFPQEALKAQAIAARSEAVSKIGLRHFSDAYDLCDDVHCQVYAGLSKRAPRTDLAVESTRGIFMIYENQIAEAYYSAVCGGHTENNENVWQAEAKPFLRGQIDASQSVFSSLRDEKTLRAWIRVRPPVFCNTLEVDVPSALFYTRKYFRWHLDYDRSELEKIISSKTGKNFGRLIDLRVLQRGVSGRVITVEVIGSDARFVLNRELQIRQSLSENTLYSSCFYIDKSSWASGIPGKFSIHGAGWGHGVGMCQSGAAMRAYHNEKFDKILTHYYPGISLKTLY